METITFKNGKIYLYLPNAKYKNKRCLGKISNRVLYQKKSKEKHLFRKTNSIGFNFDLINRGGAEFDLINVTLDFISLWCSRASILRYGTILNFSKTGLEKQVFLNLNFFKNSRIEALNEMEEIIKKNIFDIKPNIPKPENFQTNLFSEAC